MWVLLEAQSFSCFGKALGWPINSENNNNNNNNNNNINNNIFSNNNNLNNSSSNNGASNNNEGLNEMNWIDGEEALHYEMKEFELENNAQRRKSSNLSIFSKLNLKSLILDLLHILLKRMQKKTTHKHTNTQTHKHTQ